MRPELARKLTRRMWLSRAFSALLIAGAFGLASILLFWIYYEEPVTARSEATGVVSGWTRAQTQFGAGGRLHIWVDLADGRRVMINQRSRKSPSVGQEVKLERLELESGKVKYRWVD